MKPTPPAQSHGTLPVPSIRDVLTYRTAPTDSARADVNGVAGIFSAGLFRMKLSSCKLPDLLSDLLLATWRILCKADPIQRG
jgi:hypothetical protein